MNNAKEKLLTELHDAGNAAIAAHSQKFFKTGKGEYGEGDIFLGIRVPVIRTIIKKYLTLSISDVCTVLKSEYHEVRLAALLIFVAQFTRAKNEDVKKKIYTAYLKHTKYINNWDLVDCSAPQIVGGYLFTRARDELYRRVVSPVLWDRRISILATFYFIRQNDFTDTLALAEKLLEDKEDLIHKAVGWMLREVGKRDVAIEKEFLNKYCAEMPRTMLRYAIEKFPEEERRRYLTGG